MTASEREETVHFTFTWAQGRLLACSTNSVVLDHFLELVKMNQSYNTWLNYAHDLKVFFEIIPKFPEQISRLDCVSFIRQQQQAGLSINTINRRLAAISSLFKELQLLDMVGSKTNPIHPGIAGPRPKQPSQSLYRQPAKRLPQIIPEADLRRFFAALPSWRDRCLILLMWISCLRVSEVVAIRFEDIECSRRSIRIQAGKNHQERLVFMDSLTFSVLNRYLDEERGNLFPDVSFIFVGFKGKARGQVLSVNAVQKLMSYYAEKSQLAHLHPHLLRHTGITQLVRQKMAEPALRKLVGHAHPDSLSPYVHLGDDFVETEFERAQASLGSTNWLHGLTKESRT